MPDHRGLSLVLGFVLGLIAALGQAPWGLWPLTLLALAAMLAFAPRRFGPGWAFGAGHFALAMHWIMQPFFVDAARHGWMAPFALVLLAGGLALFWGAAFWAAGRARLGLTGLVALWAGAEAARALLLTGLPWAMPGHVWIGTPLAHLAAYVGPLGLTLATFALTAAIARALLPGGWARAVSPLAATALALAGWLALDPGPAPPPDPAAPLIRIVQPNIPQGEKWDDALIADHVARLLTLTAQQPEGEAATPALVVWPETAVPYLLEWAGPVLNDATAAARGGVLVAGIMRRTGEATFHNSLIVAQDTGTPRAIYDKAHLTPFGEYIPLGNWLGGLGINGLAANQGFGFTPGPGNALVDLPGIGAALPLICYEGIFAEEVAARPPGARLILLITNDAWFGTFAGPQQHLAQARLRAIETGLPLLRAANTGISALIDADGRVLDSLTLGQTGTIDATLPPAQAAPLYSRTGDWPVLVAIAALLTLGAILRDRGH
jgi:apolipoprotein N-acyltransferase